MGGMGPMGGGHDDFGGGGFSSMFGPGMGGFSGGGPMGGVLLSLRLSASSACICMMTLLLVTRACSFVTTRHMHAVTQRLLLMPAWRGAEMTLCL